MAKLFDPLGLLGPILIRANIIMLQLWQMPLAWDESVPLELFSAWKEFYSLLEVIKLIKSPWQAIVKEAVEV